METNQKEDDSLLIEFKAVLMAILDYLKHGETQRAIDYIENIINK